MIYNMSDDKEQTEDMTIDMNDVANDSTESPFDDITNDDSKVESPQDEAMQPSAPHSNDESDKLKEQLLRALADAENTRRRAQQDKEDALKYGVSNFARDMISITDNLRRALDHAPSQELSEDFQSFIKGVELTESELLASLEKHGIQKINPKGEKFDSNLHQAMLEQPTDEFEPGVVVDVMQFGYTIHGRILRPAMVTVAKKTS